MVDKFNDPLLTPKDVARHLRIPESTMYSWLGEEVDGERLVHRVAPEKRGWPSVPFVAVVEAYVLRLLRDLGLRKGAIREAAAEVRRAFRTPYAFAAQGITTGGARIFISYARSERAGAGDHQQAFRDVIDDHLQYINWDATDGFADSLRLRQYVIPVIINPSFSGGSPVVESTKVPVDAVVDLWIAGESLEDVAYEYDMSRDQVEAICRAAARTA
jgi:uncharacterized protein (DUF433 family)